MEVLNQPVRTNTIFLILAGLIMIATLWLSKKARSVTETEVNLGRQGEGHERFNPNILARGIVKYSLAAGDRAKKVIPENILSKAKTSFEMTGSDASDGPAFDLVRAGVNLTTASILIAFATSLKLPLSTTYVSFMVAMGTSLADRAWGRDSAVFRVAGVLNVIGGWFATAIIAFSVAGIFAFLIFQFKIGAIVFLVAAAAVFIYRSFTYHRKKRKKRLVRAAFETSRENIEMEKLFARLSARISGVLIHVERIVDKLIDGVIKESEHEVGLAEKNIQRLIEENENLQYELYKSIKRIDETNTMGSRILLYIFDLEQDIVQSTSLIVESGARHVRNMLSPLKQSQAALLSRIRGEMKSYINLVEDFILEEVDREVETVDRQKRRLLRTLEDAMSQQVMGIKNNAYGARNSQLMFKLILESKDLVAIAARFVKLYDRYNKSDINAGFLSFGRNMTTPGDVKNFSEN